MGGLERCGDDACIGLRGPAAAGAIADRPRSLRRVEIGFRPIRLFGGRPGVGCHRRRGQVGAPLGRLSAAVRALRFRAYSTESDAPTRATAALAIE
jgi:hypothetical protein